MEKFNELPVLSVSILSDKRINFELHGEYNSNARINGNLSGKFVAEANDEGIILHHKGNIFSLGNELVFTPSDETDNFVIRDVVIGIDFHWQQKENQKFKGLLKLLKDGDKIFALNIIDVENYLTSVISSEMNPNSSLEFLKAHSIISRSWSLAQMNKKSALEKTNFKYTNVIENNTQLIRWYDREDHKLFDVCADDHCQRYQGVTKVIAHNAYEAVKETEGLVLSYNDELCDTRFSKCCGGVSESFENVWEPIKFDYLKSIVDYKFHPDDLETDLRTEKNAEKWIESNPEAFCNTDNEKILSQVLQDYDYETKDFYRWEVKITQKEIQQLLKKKLGIDFGEIIEMTPLERGFSGRIVKLEISGTKKTFIIGKELEIRRALSDKHLYSSAFIIRKIFGEDKRIPSEFILKGAGWGHGVGLCQIGAAVMSEYGYTFDAILLHYFKGAKITKIY